MTELLTASDYARHRDCSPAAVSKAIADGRLKLSLVNVNGKVRIASAAMADLEWTANTHTAKSPAELASAIDALPLDDDETSMSFKAALTAEKTWKARSAELEYKERAAQLVDKKEVEAHFADIFLRCRTKLLGVPRKLKAVMPDVTPESVHALDTLMREALEELADGKL